MASRNTTLFVGGLDDQVTEDILFAAFIPFGPLKSVQVAKNFKDNATKGFGFVQFEAEDDAAAAVENMEGSELFGKTLHVNLAKPNAKATQRGQAVWSAEEWIKSKLQEDAPEDDEDD